MLRPVMVLMCAVLLIAGLQPTAVAETFQVNGTDLILRPFASGDAWQEDTDAKAADPNAGLFLREPDKDYWLRVVVLPTGPQTTVTTTQAVRRFRDDGFQSLKEPWCSDITPEKLAGLDGQTFTLIGTERDTGQATCRICWGTVTPGRDRVIVMALEGPAGATDDLKRLWPNIRDRFIQNPLSPWHGATQDSARTFRFARLNVELSFPSEDWQVLRDPDRAEDSWKTAVLVDRKHGIAVVMELTSVDPAPTAEAIVRMLRVDAYRQVIQPKIGNSQDVTFDGIMGKLVPVAGTMKDSRRPMKAMSWGGAHNGGLYRITVMSTPEQSDQLSSVWEQVHQGFRLLDRDYVVPSVNLLADDPPRQAQNELAGVHRATSGGQPLTPAAAARPKVIRFPELGFEFRPPGGSWEIVSGNTAEARRRLELPELFMIDMQRGFVLRLFADNADPALPELTSDTYLQSYLNTMRRIDSDMRVSEVVGMDLAGFSGRVATAVYNQKPVGDQVNVVWSYVDDESFVQLVVSGSADDSEAVRSEFSRIRDGFRRVPKQLRPQIWDVARFSFPQLNCELRLPENAWRRARELEKLTPDGDSRILVHATTDSAISLVCEDLGQDTGLSAEDILKLMLRADPNALNNPVVHPARPARIDGLPGSVCVVEGTIPGIGTALKGFLWATIHNGRAYEVRLMGQAADFPRTVNFWQQFQGGFRLIDRDLSVDLSTEFSRVIENKPFGVRADFSGLDWFGSTDAGLLFDSTMAVTRPNGNELVVIPLSLQGARPQREWLIEAALLRCKAKLDDVRLHAKKVQHGTLEAIEFFEPPAKSPVEKQRYFRMVFSEDTVWLIVMGFDRDRELPTQLIADTMARIEIEPPQGTVPVDALNDFQKPQHVHFLFDLGNIIAGAGRLDEGVEYVRMALKIAPEQIEVREGAINVMIQVENYAEALELFETAPPDLGVDPVRRAQHAWMLVEAERFPEALDKYRSVFSTDFFEEEHFRRYVKLLSREGESQQAIQLVDAQLQQNQTVDMVVLRANLISESGRTDEAIAELQRERDAAPLAGLEYSWGLINLLLDADRETEALAEVQKLVDKGHDDPNTSFLKGLCEFRLERYRQARDTLQTLVDRVDDPLAQLLLEKSTAQLGQGDVSDLSRDLEPVPLPAAVTVASMRPQTVNETDDAWVALSADAVRFIAGKEFRRTETLIVHPLTREGVEAYGSLQFEFDPLYEEIGVNRVDVFDARGKHVASTDLHDCYVLASSDSDLVTRDKVLHIPVQGLRQGGRLEVQITRRNHAAPDDLPLQRIATRSRLPIDQIVLSIDGDVDDIRWAGPAPQRTPNGLVWSVPGRRATDTDLIDDTHIDPQTITVAAADNSWQGVTTDYLERIEDRLQLDRRVKLIADEQLAGMYDAPVSERVTRLTEWARNELTYQGLEFGIRGQVMPPVAETLRNRYGDCKDHSLLMWQLLRAAGIPAHLAVVHSSRPVNPSVPDQGQFNHMILYVADELGDRFIDGTSKFNSSALRVPSGLAGKRALILDPENPRLVRIPEYAAGSSPCHVKREVHIRESGEADVSETIWIAGYRAAYFRRLVAKTDQSELRDIARYLFLPGNGKGCTLTEFKFSNERDLSGYLVVELTYSIRDLMLPARNQLIGRLPAEFESGPFVSVAELNPERTEPFRVGAPQSLRSRTEIHLPAGFQLAALPDNLDGGTTWVSIRRSSSQTGSVMAVDNWISTAGGSYEATQWQLYQQVVRRTADALTPRLLLEKITTE